MEGSHGRQQGAWRGQPSRRGNAGVWPGQSANRESGQALVGLDVPGPGRRDDLLGQRPAAGLSEARSQPDSADSSQLRTNCLSKLGWATPGCHAVGRPEPRRIRGQDLVGEHQRRPRHPGRTRTWCRPG